MSFFSTNEKKLQKKNALRLDRVSFAIDNSGSTAGQVLRDEIASAKLFFTLLSEEKNNFQILKWNSNSSWHKSLDEISCSTGGTEPSCIVFDLARYQPELLIFYTDGECSDKECENLRRLLIEKNLKMPLIVVFTLKESLKKQSVTLQEIQSQVNMSIPNGLMSVTSDVLILLNLNNNLNLSNNHRVLMASGCFAEIYKPMDLNYNFTLEILPAFHFSMMKEINFVEKDELPIGCILLNGFANPIILDRLYEAIKTCEEVSTELIKALTDRMLLPRLDLDRLHAACVEFLTTQTIEKNSEYKEALENLMRVAAQSNKSQEHIDCRQKLDAIKAKIKNTKTLETSTKNAAVHDLLQLIANYRANANGFVLGSNRANRATVISATESDLLLQKLQTTSDNTIVLPECPILLEPGNACILLTTSFHDTKNRKKNWTDCDEPNKKLLDFCTGDYYTNNAFSLGADYIIVTPRVFSAEFGLDCTRNPFTNQTVYAKIVLVKDLKLLMQQLCRAFCASREMWHMPIAFASMLAEHLLEDEWAEREILLPYLNWLIDAIKTTKNFSNDIGLPKVTLREAIDHVLQNYQVELRKFLPANARAMINIPLALAKFLKKDLQHIYSYLKVVEIFQELLTDYKKGQTDPLDYIMQRDPIYQHCIEPKKGLLGIVGMIIFQDSLPQNRKRFALKNKSFQDALDYALLKAKESNDNSLMGLYRAFQGENVDTVTPLCLPAIPKNTSHFGEENFDRTSTVDGKKYLVCGYCGFSRQVSTYEKFLGAKVSKEDEQARLDMREHLIRMFTPQYFYNGSRCVEEACQELGVAAPETSLFVETKKKLYAKHGKDFWALHTTDTKNQLLYFIRMRKYEAKLLKEKPLKD